MASRVTVATKSGNSQVIKKPDPFEERFLALEELSGESPGENDVIFEGNKIVLPANYTIQDGIKHLVKKDKDLETPVQLARTFDYRPMDGAHAFYSAVVKHFGSLNSKAFKAATFFSKQQGTQWLDVPVGVGETKSVPWGQVFTPLVPDNPITLGQIVHPEKGPLFTMTIECPKKYKRRIEGLFKVVQRELEEHSIYRGKAFDGKAMPNFLDLTGIDPEKVVFPQLLERHLQFNIFDFYTKRAKKKARGRSMKRSVLLEGYYGSGKTMALRLTGKMAVDHGQTFILCGPDDDLMQALQTAALYQPATVGFEDLDVVASANPDVDDPAAAISLVLDKFDGMRAKGLEIMCVVTTNHADKLHQGMLRPGRLDGVIEFGKFDHDGIRRLIEVCVGGNLDPNTNWDQVFPHYEDLMPAFIVEAAGRSVDYADDDESEPIVSEIELILGKQSLDAQLQKMENAPEMSERDKLGQVMHSITERIVEEAKEEIIAAVHGE